jgi:hypothetical protein
VRAADVVALLGSAAVIWGGLQAIRAWAGRTATAATRVERGLANDAIAGALSLGVVLVLHWAEV